jgi:hypothetical protein
MAFRHIEQQATLYATLVGLVALALDYLTGPHIRFPVLFVFPVVIASWYRNRVLGMAFAVVLSLLSFGLARYWHPLLPQNLVESIVNASIYIAVLGALAFFTAHHRALQQQVQVLRGILPICSFCKKIRDRDGNWQVMEGYIRSHSEAEFSHGLCPSCAQEHYEEYLPSPDDPPQTR